MDTDTPPTGDALVAAARAFAERAHAGRTRSNRARSPYVVHLAEVAGLVRGAGGTAEEEAAAWLHDTVEDIGVGLDEIRRRFGGAVADLVDGLTDPEGFAGMPVLERKTLQAERVRAKPPGVKRVKIADQVSNVRAVAFDPPDRWSTEKCRDYAEGARRIVAECAPASPVLAEFFRLAHEAAVARHGA